MIHTRNIVALLVLAGLMLRFAWVGYIHSDDIFYADSARGWIAQFPWYVGDTHWSLRHTFVLPLALSFSLWGENQASLAAVSILYFLALVVFTYAISAKQLGTHIALAICAALITTPVFAIWSTIATPDIAETFFIAVSVWVFFRATETGRTALFVGAGLLAGLAWLTRETALSVVLFYGVLFLFYPRVPRSKYFLVALGFLLPVVAELVYFWANTGDPLYRLWVDIDQGRSRGAAQHGHTGNFEINKWLNPWLAVLVNQNFALLFFLAAPALLWLWRQRKAKIPPWLILVGLLLVVSFLTIAYIMPVRKLPRYFEVSTYAAVCLTVAWLGSQVWPRRPYLAAGLYALLIGTNLLAIYMDNRDPLFGEHALADWAVQHPGPIYTDPDTLDGAQFFLKAQGVSRFVSATPPPAGALYFYNPNRVNAADQDPAYRKQYTPLPTWPLAMSITPQPKVLGAILAKLGLAEFFPDRIIRKLSSPNDPIMVYRVTR